MDSSEQSFNKFKNMKNTYTTDGKVKHIGTEKDINIKLSEILGEKFIRYRKKWNEVHENLSETDFPMFLQIEPNQNCNYKCPHCLLGDKDIVKKYKDKVLTYSLYKKIVDEGYEHDCPSLSLQGWNEPLAMKNFFAYIKYAENRNFIDIMVNSNGSLLDDSKIKSILDSGITRMRFSMDAATPETYKKARLEGGFEKIKMNIAKLVEERDKNNYKLPIIGTSFCETSVNTHEKQLFVETWSQIVDFVSLQTFMPPVFDKVYDRFFTKEQRSNKNVPENFKCPQPFERVSFHDNNIYACCNYAARSDTKIGNIEKDTIYEAWNSKKAKRLREISRKGEYYKIPECNTCVKSTFGYIDFSDI